MPQDLVPAPRPTASTPPPGPKPAETDASRMSFFEHLNELRRRLIYSIIVVSVAAFVCFNWAHEIMSWAMWPLHQFHSTVELKLQTVEPTEAFVQEVKLAITCGLLITAPFLLLQLWLFISPGLYAHEKRYVVPFVLVGSTFFVGGAAFCFRWVLPASLQFLLEQNPVEAVAGWTLEHYIALVSHLMLGFGLVFELPLIMTVLGALGVVRAEQFAAFRKYWIIIAAVIAAVITPTPDAMTMMLMAVPLWVFYEMGIIGARMLRKKPKSAAAA